MKERPILFSAPMVRAILSGQKTQTRRIVPAWQMPKRTQSEFDGHQWISVAQRGRWGFGLFGRTEDECMANYRNDYSSLCPYGMRDDRLWVRETFAIEAVPDDGDMIVRSADKQANWIAWRPEQAFYLPSDYKPSRWRPSIHMPRWASRINLEITGIRVERLQDISAEDAKAEGLDSFTMRDVTYWRNYLLDDEEAQCSLMLESPIESYRTLWESINGVGSWDKNPWVWVIEFKRVAA